MLFLAGWLGEKRSAPDKDLAYESGIIPSGEARFAFPAAFYLVAVFFLVFDLETAFIYAWAVAARELGLAGWGRMVFFVVVLLAGLVYVWAQGGLSWRTTPRRGPTA
ncbi:MAG: NADH-quinone oxidoreductase subunit A [Deltaproteobacteria bacterium]|nr:NADH-quinone oxidoreductase subunit A [Deltaproteobacteria bacterium]